MSTKIEKMFDEDGIPFDPNVTNEYYKNDDFENDSSPERGYGGRTLGAANFSTTYNNTTRNSMSRTVAPNRRRVTTAVPRHKILGNKSASQSSLNSNQNNSTLNNRQSNLIASKTLSGAQPRSSQAARAEYEHLIDYMQYALDGASSNNGKFLSFQFIFKKKIMFYLYFIFKIKPMRRLVMTQKLAFLAPT
jgi:hypothetical protein